MPFLLDPDSAEPLYRQLRDSIEQAVADGQFRDSALPSSRALAIELGISRTTVNLAFQELVAEGFLYSEPRSGFRVNSELLSYLREHDTTRATVRSRLDSIPDWALQVNDLDSHALPAISKDPEWHRYRYPFVYGQVAPDSFPANAWMRALRTAMEPGHIAYSLRDAGSEDDPLLVQQLCQSVLPQRGIRARPEEVLITNGAQNGLFLTASALIRAGDRVAVENPGYPDANHIFARSGATLVPVDADSSGLDVHAIPAGVRFVSVTPSHHFPTNATLSIARRRVLLELARTTDAFVIEDDYDSEFRYVGQPTPALKAFGGDRVIYIGSFSKFLAPGVRLGYIVAAPELITFLREARRYSVRHPAGQLQRALALLTESGDYHRALRRHRSSLKDKWKLMSTAIKRELDWKLDVPTGGTSMWLPVPQGIDSDALTEAAADKDVLIESGTTFFMDKPAPHSHIRLGYAAIPVDRIDAGLRRLGEVVRSQS